MSIEAMKQALAKFEHLWEIGIDAEYKVELLPEIEALRQAIEQAEKQEKLCNYCGGIGRVVCDGRCMPEQEPVAWIKVWDEKEKKHVLMNYYITPPPKREIDMSTKPENIDTSEECVHETDKSVHDDDDIQEYKRPWVSLTDEEIKDILDCGRGGLVDIKKAEQILKEKNT
jgi:hypothetical protein